MREPPDRAQRGDESVRVNFEIGLAENQAKSLIAAIRRDCEILD